MMTLGEVIDREHTLSSPIFRSHLQGSQQLSINSDTETQKKKQIPSSRRWSNRSKPNRKRKEKTREWKLYGRHRERRLRSSARLGRRRDNSLLGEEEAKTIGGRISRHGWLRGISQRVVFILWENPNPLSEPKPDPNTMDEMISQPCHRKAIIPVCDSRLRLGPIWTGWNFNSQCV